MPAPLVPQVACWIKDGVRLINLTSCIDMIINKSVIDSI